MNYKKLFDSAVAAECAGESLVLKGTSNTVAVRPASCGRLRITPLDKGGEPKVICEDDFQTFASAEWTIHPNFQALMNEIGGKDGA